jgi:hypothetical protein
MVFLTLCANLIGSTALLRDTNRGAFDVTNTYPLYLYYTQYPALKQAFDTADKLAQQHHANRIYLASDLAFHEILRYFAPQLHTPVTILDVANKWSTGNCVTLPSPDTGPSVFMVAPYTPLVNELIQHFANTTVTQQSMIVGGDPFRLYVMNTKSTRTPEQSISIDRLHLLETQRLGAPPDNWLVTHWEINESKEGSWRSEYHYKFWASPLEQNTEPMVAECTLTSVQPGTQLFATFKATPGTNPRSLDIVKVEKIVYQPWLLQAGPFNFQTYLQRIASQQAFSIPGGRQKIYFSLP